MGDLTNNFSEIEYTCNCGCDTYIDAKHIANEDQALRDFIAKEIGKEYRMIIHCGLRCEKHNRRVGGVSGSHHLPVHYENEQGASDKHMHGMSNWRFRRLAKKAYKLEIITALGLYRWGIHSDTGRKRRWGNFWNK